MAVIFDIIVAICSVFFPSCDMKEVAYSSMNIKAYIELPLLTASCKIWLMPSRSEQPEMLMIVAI